MLGSQLGPLPACQFRVLVKLVWSHKLSLFRLAQFRLSTRRLGGQGRVVSEGVAQMIWL